MPLSLMVALLSLSVVLIAFLFAPPHAQSFRSPLLGSSGEHVAFPAHAWPSRASRPRGSPGVQHALAASLCAIRRLDDNSLELLTPGDAGITELVVPECSHVSTHSL